MYVIHYPVSLCYLFWDITQLKFLAATSEYKSWQWQFSKTLAVFSVQFQFLGQFFEFCTCGIVMIWWMAVPIVCRQLARVFGLTYIYVPCILCMSSTPPKSTLTYLILHFTLTCTLGFFNLYSGTLPNLHSFAYYNPAVYKTLFSKLIADTNTFSLTYAFSGHCT